MELSPGTIRAGRDLEDFMHRNYLGYIVVGALALVPATASAQSIGVGVGIQGFNA
jgi:hypothetical protein